MYDDSGELLVSVRIAEGVHPTALFLLLGRACACACSVSVSGLHDYVTCDLRDLVEMKVSCECRMWKVAKEGCGKLICGLASRVFPFCFTGVAVIYGFLRRALRDFVKDLLRR